MDYARRFANRQGTDGSGSPYTRYWVEMITADWMTG